MEINYLLAGLYKEEAARDIFERLCALMILNKYSEETLGNINKDSLEDFIIEENQDEIKIKSLSLNEGEVFHIQTRQGDGGLDIVYEKDDLWNVFQCKFFVDGKIGGNNSREVSITGSLRNAIDTARKRGKTIREWYLCVPLDLDIKDKEWWDKFKESNKEVKIKKMDNLEINNMLIENNNIFDFYFKRLIPDDKGLEINLQLNRYIRNFKQEISRLDDYYFKKPSRIFSLYLDYKPIFNYISGLQESFIGVTEILGDLENWSNSNKERFDQYETEEKGSIKGTGKEQIFSENMLKRQEDLKQKYEEIKYLIDNYIERLEEFNTNFRKYFIRN